MNMLLRDILYKVNLRSVSGTTEIEINELQSDSRSITKGDCFIAMRGTLHDGHNHIADAVSSGAIAVICEELPEYLNEDVTYVEVMNTSVAAGIMSHTFFGEPSLKLKLVGITGTNGKTTIATLLYKLFSALDYTCGLVSTVQNIIGNESFGSTHTTPDAITLNRLLALMVKQNCSYAFMEVSSHAIAQHRVSGLYFTGAVFTNITHEHLDYHKTFNEYIRVKKSWFDHLPSTAFAISNADDKRGGSMLENTQAKKIFYGLKTLATFKGKVLENSLAGLHMLVNEKEVHFKMIGEFNAYNILAVVATALSLDQNLDDVLQCLSTLTGAEGRFDYTLSKKHGIVGIVDYAHTPDALLNVLVTIKNLRQGHEKVITVVGCGGNRDASKRPVMAQVACEYSDKVILTSDNPRNEDEDAILSEMENGVNAAAKKKVITIKDRKEAIKAAVSLSGDADILLIAGKGHEKYQEVKGVKYHFDDKKILEEMFELLEK